MVQAPLFIPLGSHCYPTFALLALNMRTLAYPFDWLVTPFDGLYNCLDQDFKCFFTNLKITEDKLAVTDFYGFRYYHDNWHPNYANQQTNKNDPYSGVPDDWEIGIPSNQEKYQRRINRFNLACFSTNKLIFLRATEITKDGTITLIDLFKKKYLSLDFELLAFGKTEDFREPFNQEKVRNFYCPNAENVDFYKQVIQAI